MGRTICLCVMATALLCGSVRAAETVPGAPAVPKEVCVLVELKDAPDLSGRLSGFVAALMPQAGPLPVEAMLAMQVKTMDPTVVDWSSPWFPMGSSSFHSPS